MFKILILFFISLLSIAKAEEEKNSTISEKTKKARQKLSELHSEFEK